MKFISKSWFFIILTIIVVFAIFFNFYNFYYLKNNYYTIESTCDPSIESCFIRSCEDVECPPNELTIYKMFSISSKDFDSCIDDSCSNICGLSNSCTQIECGENEDDTCIGPNEQSI